MLYDATSSVMTKKIEITISKAALQIKSCLTCLFDLVAQYRISDTLNEGPIEFHHTPHKVCKHNTHSAQRSTRHNRYHPNCSRHDRWFFPLRTLPNRLGLVWEWLLPHPMQLLQVKNNICKKSLLIASIVICDKFLHDVPCSLRFYSSVSAIPIKSLRSLEVQLLLLLGY